MNVVITDGNYNACARACVANNLVRRPAVLRDCVTHTHILYAGAYCRARVRTTPRTRDLPTARMVWRRVRRAPISLITPGVPGVLGKGGRGGFSEIKVCRARLGELCAYVK